MHITDDANGTIDFETWYSKYFRTTLYWNTYLHKYSDPWNTWNYS